MMGIGLKCLYAQIQLLGHLENNHLLNKIYPHFKFDQKLEIKSPTWQKGVTKTDRSTISTSCERCICNNVYIARRHDFYRDMTSHRHKIWFWLRIKIVFYFTFYFIRQEIRVIIVHELVHISTSHFFSIMLAYFDTFIFIF